MMAKSKQPYIKWSERKAVEKRIEEECGFRQATGQEPRPSIPNGVGVVRRNFKWTPENKERLAVLARTKDDREIALELGCTEKAAHRARYQFSVPSSSRIRLEQQRYRDLLAERVRDLAGVLTNREIAEELEVGQVTVEHIRRMYGIHGRSDGRTRESRPMPPSCLAAGAAARKMRQCEAPRRVERMLELMERCRSLRGWMQSVA